MRIHHTRHCQPRLLLERFSCYVLVELIADDQDTYFRIISAEAYFYSPSYRVLGRSNVAPHVQFRLDQLAPIHFHLCLSIPNLDCSGYGPNLGRLRGSYSQDDYLVEPTNRRVPFIAVVRRQTCNIGLPKHNERFAPDCVQPASLHVTDRMFDGRMKISDRLNIRRFVKGRGGSIDGGRNVRG